LMLGIWNFQRQVSQFILGMTINRGITNYIITGFVSYLQCNAKGKMKEQAKQKFGELVDRFRYNLDVYKKSTYNETQVRREFIDPFFEALGWDVSNKQGFAEQYKEVVPKGASFIFSFLLNTFCISFFPNLLSSDGCPLYCLNFSQKAWETIGLSIIPGNNFNTSLTTLPLRSILLVTSSSLPRSSSVD